VRIKKRPKIECEICGETDERILHRHHIVERTEANTSNDDFNIAIICPTCHSKVHDKSIKIIGVFPGTRPPSGRILVYIKDGVCNVPELENEQPYYTPKPPSMKVHQKEENK
jgi:hypothetical protein